MTAPDIVFGLNRLPHYWREAFDILFRLHPITIAYSDDPESANKIRAASVEAPTLQLKEVRWGPIRWQRGMLQLVTRRTDLVIFRGDVRYLSTWAAVLKAKATRTRTVTWGHGWSSEQRPPLRWVRTIFYRLAGEMWVYTDAQARRAINYGVPPGSVFTIGNATNGAPLVRGQDKGTLRVGFIGRLVHRRKLGLLFSAVRQIESSGRRVFLEIIGAGEDELFLRALAQESGLSVDFLGEKYDNEELARVISRWTLSVVPAFAGLSIITAFSQGCPVIVSDDPDENGPEWNAVLPGVNGWHFRAGDSADLARMVVEAAGSSRLPTVSSEARCTYERDWSPFSLARRMARRIDFVLGAGD